MLQRVSVWSGLAVSAVALFAACSDGSDDPNGGNPNGVGKGDAGENTGVPPISPPGACAKSVVTPPGKITVPSAHPRLWWNADRLARGKQWLASNPQEPDADDPLGFAMLYALSGDVAAAQKAISMLMAFTIDASELAGVASDNYRWADWVPVVFDWCYEAMTPQQRDTIIARYNGYASTLMKKEWGGVDMQGNNYFWGYLRNELNWGIASYGHSTSAQMFLDHALNTRYTSAFLPYAAGVGGGGVPAEGSQYGAYTLGYTVVPFVSSALMGRDLFSETPFWKESIFYLIYSTSPAPTFLKPTAPEKAYELFPYNDDEKFVAGGTAEDAYYGDLMSALADKWSDRDVGKYARRWLATVKPEVSPFVQAATVGGDEKDFASLPLDFYAPGTLKFFYLRNKWGPDATTLNLQLGYPTGAGHAHVDAGTFMMWRKGRWLTRETTGYSDEIVGFGGTGSVETAAAHAHNGLLVGGQGLAEDEIDGPPEITRLESRNDYSYGVVDLSKAFRNHETDEPARDNGNVSKAIREFVFIRGLETLVVFDRIESTSERSPAATVPKTFLVHFQTSPQIEGASSVLGVNGDQALHLTTLVPSAPNYRVVVEGGAVGQHRLEITTSGAASSYFINVLQARDQSAPNLISTVTEDGTHYTVTLKHPSQGTAQIVFTKGMTSTGGEVGYAATGSPTMTPLGDKVQELYVGDCGPVWQ